ncbi:MAG: NYN domain-containing protein [Candidatus Omnitrophota bacterium]
MSLFYIVDGYNVIKRSDRFADLSLREARARFFVFLESRRPHGSLRNRLIVVFDGSPEVFGFREDTSFEVVFTSGESADDKIKSLVEGLSSDAKRAVVVTDDRDLARSVRLKGARIMSVGDFLGKPQRKERARRSQSAAPDAGNTLNVVERERITEEFRKLWLGP